MGMSEPIETATTFGVQTARLIAFIHRAGPVVVFVRCRTDYMPIRVQHE